MIDFQPGDDVEVVQWDEMPGYQHYFNRPAQFIKYGETRLHGRMATIMMLDNSAVVTMYEHRVRLIGIHFGTGYAKWFKQMQSVYP